MTSNNTFSCPEYSGPNCTDGTRYHFEICSSLFPHPDGQGRFTAAISQCIMSRLTDYEQLSLGLRSYVLTLWPAFVGIIARFGPDPSDVVYDNIWWSLLFAVTCGGFPGLSTLRPSHHLEVENNKKARELCITKNNSLQAALVRPRSKRQKSPMQNRVALGMEWIVFIASVSLYCAFIYYFAYTLSWCFVTSFVHSLDSHWYYVSATPAFGMMLSEVLQGRLELYELEDLEAIPEPDLDKAKGPSQAVCPSDATVVDSSVTELAITTTTNVPVRFKRVPQARFFRIWWHVLKHQFSGTSYRLLVRPYSRGWFFGIWRLALALYRVFIFVGGSSFMGRILMFSPKGNDYWGAVLLVLVSALPRFSWPAFWNRSPHGADLVVFVKPVDDEDID